MGRLRRRRMAKRNPLRWLAHRAAIGVKDLPANAAWALSNALPPPAERAAGRAAEGATHIARRVPEVVQGLSGVDTFDARLRRAQEASERALRAEQKALAEASEAQ